MNELIERLIEQANELIEELQTEQFEDAIITADSISHGIKVVLRNVE